jgi:predicted acyl esterase
MLLRPSRHLLALLVISASPFFAAPQQSGDIPKTFTAPTAQNEYVKREVMIPMRDGVKLYTVIVIPKGTRNAPIVLTRTPYNASKRLARNDSPHLLAVLPLADAEIGADGYIRAFQDVRGKYRMAAWA